MADGDDQSQTNQTFKGSSFAVNHLAMGGSAMNVMSLHKSTGSNDGRSMATYTDGTAGLNTINSTNTQGEKDSDSDNDELKEL